MKKILSLFIVFYSLLSAAQSTFILQGEGGFKNGDKIYLVYKTTNSPIIDSTIVTDHAFEFRGTINSIFPAYLCRNDNPQNAAVLYDSKDLYLEPGLIRINTKDSLKKAELFGTPTNNDLSELTKELKVLKPERDKIEDDYDALTPEQTKDINLIAPIRARLKTILLKMAPIQFAFIKSHPNSYVSLATLQQTVSNPDLLQQNEEAFNVLSDRLKQTSLGIHIGQVLNASVKTASGLIATDFTLPDTNGKQIKLSDFRGKYVLVDFWASWCLPCREENPNIRLAYNKFQKKGFEVIGISIDNSRGKSFWIKAIKSDDITWTQVLDFDDDNKKVKAAYGVTTIPANILISPNGKIIARNIKDKVLLDKLRGLLGNE